MNDKLECLKKLQEVLKEKFSLEDEVKSIPAHLREEEAKLESDRKKYEELKENLENLTKEHKSLAIRYEDASSQRIGYEKQVEFINTQREFEALAKQLEEAKILEQSLLKQRDSKEQELKALEKAVAAAEADFNSQLQVVEDEHKKVDGKLSDIEESISKLDAECASIKGSVISDELFDKFSNIVRKKGGDGVVPVYGQVCTGCDLILPMQFVIDLQIKTQNGDIEYCPYCSRIIYKEELDEDMEKAYTFEQLEPSKAEGKGQDKKQQDGEQGDEDSGFDSTLGGDFEGF